MKYYCQRKFIHISLSLLLIASGSMKPLISLSQDGPHYNVLFIVVDDMNEKASVFGYPEVLTPNLQRLVNRGIVFRRAYCQFPLCNPSRTSLLTGWRPDKTGVFDNGTSPRSKVGNQVKFLPEYFSQFGYHTERVGKVMHGVYQNQIAWDYSDKTNADDLSKGSTPGSWWVRDLPDASTINGIYAGIMIKRMRLQPPQPFFLALGLTVHNPFTPSLKYWNMYGDPSVQQLLPIDKNGNTGDLKGNGSGNIKLPNTPPGDRNDVPRIAFPIQVNKTTTDWQNTVHAYYAEVTEMDAQLGSVLDEMDRQNLWQNTVVVLIADHGQHLGEHEGLWGKTTLFEESDLVPLIVCVPGKPAGVCNALVESVDMYPSLAEICSLPAPSGMEGSSFARLIDNVNEPWKRAVFTQVKRRTTEMYSASTTQYRYNSWGSSGEELYDHLTDPFEYTNLAGNAAYTSVLKMMRTILAEGWTKSLPPEDDLSFVSTDNYVAKATIGLQTTIKTFPNPSDGNMFVSLTSLHAGMVRLNVYDSFGRIILSTTNAISEGHNTFSIHLDSIAAGLYTLEVKNKEVQQLAKLVIEK
ncbi:sulfatase-like hydrolase/transferase [Panacibacter ginsenosidivorans]|uniref:Sulfatase-like hydrolase/transferase n=1 Tax=Panacibacter ginsenosidivorans TaxID=1813871 RepID=A0A5B8V3P1_9BACT|nr:sulfatase-like hydrolase/transferase [Panacibacter ginsenosidivorans]QEC65994.1 sulfatase-like hydrolase/transferase [Panacibacter ginsenosidivorans]